MTSANTEENQNDSSSPNIYSLTRDEEILLNRALDQVKSVIIKQVVNKIMKWTALIGGVVGVFGIVSFISIKDSIKEAAVIRLKEDPQLRAEIKESAEAKLQEKADKADKLIAEIQLQKYRLEQEKRDANVLLNQSLNELNDLIKQWADKK